jgi:rhodanese-related sulfurtransferase
LGVRCPRIAKFLVRRGHANVKNHAVGILAWADWIDLRMPKY